MLKRLTLAASLVIAAAAPSMAQTWPAKAVHIMLPFGDGSTPDIVVRIIADGLKPSTQGKRIAFDGPGRTVIDGPFAETRELVAGFWIWDVKDMEEAVAWVKRCPNPMPGPSEIEIRPFYEMADLQ